MLVSPFGRSPRPYRLTLLVNLIVTLLVIAATLIGAARIVMPMNRPEIWRQGSMPLIALISAWFTLWIAADLRRAASAHPPWHGVPELFSSALRWGGLLLVLLVLLRAGTTELSLAGMLVTLGVPARLTAWILPRFILGRLGYKVPARVLVAGSGSAAQLVAASMVKYDPNGTTVVGFVDERADIETDQILSLPTYDIAHLDRLVSVLHINRVVVAVSSLSESLLARIKLVGQEHPEVEITLTPAHSIAAPSRTRVLDVYGFALFDLQWRRRRIDDMLKALFDRGFAAVGLLVCAPLLIAAAIAIRLESPGPLLFRQERVGQGGKIFKMYKLRSMRAPRPGEHLDNPDRYTGVGALLRKYSIDELPQLLNVLRGEMSVVGPRPEREEYVRLFSDEIPGYQRRHTVRGGLTGLAQVKGARGDTSIVERTRLDNFYVDYWSFWLDVKIILLTFKALAPRSQGIGGPSMFLDLVTEVALGRTGEPVGDAMEEDRETPQLQEAIS